MTSPTLEHAARTAVAAYTGRAVVTLDAIEDPIRPGWIAIRATVHGLPQPLEFLTDLPITEASLEEVAFTCWPPKARV